MPWLLLLANVSSLAAAPTAFKTQNSIFKTHLRSCSCLFIHSDLTMLYAVFQDVLFSTNMPKQHISHLYFTSDREITKPNVAFAYCRKNLRSVKIGRHINYQKTLHLKIYETCINVMKCWSMVQILTLFFIINLDIHFVAQNSTIGKAHFT